MNKVRDRHVLPWINRVALQLLALALCAASRQVEAETKIVTIFEGRQVSVDVPPGWKFVEKHNRATGVQTLEILDAREEVELDISFVPDPADRLASREGLETEMRKAFQFYLDSSVEREMKFTFFDAPDGRGGYTSFTDRSLVGRTKIPKGERLISTPGMRSWKGAYLIFTLLTNSADTKTWREALEIVRTGLKQTRGPVRSSGGRPVSFGDAGPEPVVRAQRRPLP